MKHNIDIVFKENISKSQKKHLMIAFYTHVIKCFKEIIMLAFWGRKRLGKKVKLVGFEHYIEAASCKNGVLLLTGHLGNWEFSYTIAMERLQKTYGQFCLIRREIKNKFIQKVLFKNTEDSGFLIIRSRGARNKVIQALKEGFGLFFALDQHASIKKHVGIPVNFFGMAAGTYMGLAVNAQNKMVPVVPVYSYRQKDGTHVIKFNPPLLWQEYSCPEQAIYENTLIYNQVLEKMILEHPEQWLWVHRRWKLQQ